MLPICEKTKTVDFVFALKYMILLSRSNRSSNHVAFQKSNAWRPCNIVRCIVTVCQGRKIDVVGVGASFMSAYESRHLKAEVLGVFSAQYSMMNSNAKNAMMSDLQVVSRESRYTNCELNFASEIWSGKCQNSLKRPKMGSKYAPYEVKMSSLGACESVFETNNPA